jgi:hypothetical protein
MIVLARVDRLGSVLPIAHQSCARESRFEQPRITFSRMFLNARSDVKWITTESPRSPFSVSIAIRIVNAALRGAANRIAWFRHCEERSDEAIHSSVLWHDGLLRGACHRARIRATRWLAMTAHSTHNRKPRARGATGASEPNAWFDQ